MTCGENGGEKLICFYLLNLGKKLRFFESVLEIPFLSTTK